MNWFAPDITILTGIVGRSRAIGEIPHSKRRAAWDRAYRERNRESIRERDRAYYLAKRKGKPMTRNADARRSAARARYWRNRGRMSAASLARYHGNPAYREAARLRMAATRARRKTLSTKKESP